MWVTVGSLLTHRQRKHGVGRRDRGGSYLPPPPGWIKLTGSFPETSVADLVPGIMVPGWGSKFVKPLGSLYASPPAGHNRGPGGG